MPDEIFVSINTKQTYTQSPSAIIDSFDPDGWVDSNGTVYQHQFRNSELGIPSIVVTYHADDMQVAYHAGGHRRLRGEQSLSD